MNWNNLQETHQPASRYCNKQRWLGIPWAGGMKITINLWLTNEECLGLENRCWFQRRPKLADVLFPPLLLKQGSHQRWLTYCSPGTYPCPRPHPHAHLSNYAYACFNLSTPNKQKKQFNFSLVPVPRLMIIVVHINKPGPRMLFIHGVTSWN